MYPIKHFSLSFKKMKETKAAVFKLGMCGMSITSHALC